MLRFHHSHRSILPVLQNRVDSARPQPRRCLGGTLCDSHHPGYRLQPRCGLLRVVCPRNDVFYVISFFQLFLGPTEFAIQLASITIGLATLAAFYLLIRRLFDVRIALIATFLLAVSGWHLTFSRVGWRLILVPLFASLILYFLVRAVQERRPRDFVLAGVFLGLSLGTYEAARILPFIAAAYLIYEVARTPALLRTHSRHLALFGMAAVLAFAPVGWYMLHHWTLYTQRSDVLWIGNQINEAGSLDPLFGNVKSALLMFNFRANGNDFFVQQPLLDLPVSVFFTLGLTYSITLWRRPGYFLLLVMSVFTLAICIASEPNGNRGIIALIPAMAFAAVFLFQAWRWLADSFPRYANVFSILLVAVLLYSAFASYDSYLGPNRRTQEGYDEEATIVGQYMDRLTNDNQVYAAAGNWAGFTMTYFSYPGQGDPFVPAYRYYTNAEALLQIPPAADQGTVFIIAIKPYATAIKNTLAQRFPAATESVIPSDDPSQPDIAHVLLIPPGAGPGADLSAYVPAGAAERDARRSADLDGIAEALLDRRRRGQQLPASGGTITVACVSGELGPLCPLKDQIGAESFEDPRGSPLRFGYWYESDGTHFSLYASFESLPPADKACHPRDGIVVDKFNLYCLHY